MKNRAVAAFVASLVVLVGFATSSRATTYLVWTNGAQVAPYDTWPNAFSNIQDAVNYAASNDVILVTNGLYLTSSEITVTNSVRIEGVSGAANTIVRRSTVGTGAPQHRIFNLTKPGTVIKGLTIANGYRPANIEGDRGGGVRVSAGGCVIMDSSILHNGTAANYGGGLYATPAASGLVVSNCVVATNGCLNYGAGIFTYGANSKVLNCLVSSNSANYNGGVSFFSADGLVANCTVVDNKGLGASAAGGVFFFQAARGIVRNSLIARNQGAGIAYDFSSVNGSVQSCTIVSNRSATANQGGGLFLDDTGLTISNSIVYFNAAPIGTAQNYTNTLSSTFSHSCTLPIPAGTGNTGADPLLTSLTGGNYHLLLGSPCIDTGLSNTWMNGAKDFDGEDRIRDGVPDIGVDEFSPGALVVNFTADTLIGWHPLQVTFTAFVSGSNLTGLVYMWDFNSDGTNDSQGAELGVVTNVYSPGTFSVKLTVTNSAGESNSYERLSYIQCGVQTAYVHAASSSPLFPYTNWATAAQGIQEAVNAGIDGTVVLVSNGTYVLSAPITLSKAITVQGVSGPAGTLVNGNNAYLCFDIASPNAVVDGLTITNGRAITSDGPGGVINRGLLKNCWLVNNTATTGGGALRNFGTTSNCLIQGNVSSYGAVFMGDGVVTHCRITRNRGTSYGGGGIFFETRGFVRNCLITSNSAPRGGGVEFFNFSSAGSDMGLENCTIASNVANAASVTLNGYEGGGIYFNGKGSAKNCIIYDNISSNIAVHGNTAGGTGRLLYTCTTNPVIAGEGNITGPPLFLGPAVENFRLPVGSPCVNAGTNLTWTTNATDLDGKPRVFKLVVDMGAYESTDAAGTVMLLR